MGAAKLQRRRRRKLCSEAAGYSSWLRRALAALAERFVSKAYIALAGTNLGSWLLTVDCCPLTK